MGALKIWDGSQWVSIGPGSVPVRRLRRVIAAAQTIADDGAFHKIVFGASDAENTDTALFVWAASSLTITQAGVYGYNVNIPWTASSVGRRSALLTLNDGDVAPGGAGTATIIDGDTRAAPPSGTAKTQFGGSRRFAANDVLRIYGLQNAGVSLDTMTDSFGPGEFTIERTGD